MKEKSSDYPEAEELYVRQYRYINFSITYDKYLVCSCFENNRIFTFESEEDALAYCTQRGAELSNWYYTGIDESSESITTQLIDEYSISTLPKNYSVIKYNNKEEVRGIITDLKYNNNTISLRLRQIDYGYDEEIIGTVNRGLSALCDEAIGKYKTGFLICDNVYYDKIITINTATHEIIESDS